MQISFNKDGTIAKIFRQEWENVKAGDIIAQLDTSSQQLAIQQAQTNLQLSQARLSELMRGADNSTLTQLQNDINQSTLWLDTIELQVQSLKTEKSTKKLELQQQLTQLSGEIATARLELANANSQSGENLNDTIATYGTQIKSSLQQLQSTTTKLNDLYDKMDYIFGVTDQYKNSRSRIYLSAKNIQQLYSVQTTLLTLISRHKQLPSLDIPVSVDSESYDIVALKTHVNTLLALLKDTQAWIPIAHQSITDSVEWWSFTSQVIDQYKTTLTQQSSILDSSFTTLQNTYTQLLNMKSRSDLVTETETSLMSKQNQLNKLLSQYLQVYNQLNQSDSNYQQQILAKQAEQQKQQGQITLTTQKLEETKDWPTSQAILQQQLQIKLQEISLKQAQQNLRDYQIIAPFDGTIDKIDFKEKEQLMGSKKFVTLTNPDRYEINVNLDQVDIISIQEWQQVSIILSSFPNKTFTGRVERIYRIPVSDSSTISYTVSVWFMASGISIFKDMYGTVSFVLGQDNTNTPLIPLKAIQYDTWSATPYIWRTISSGNYEKQVISIWLTDGNMIQVSSGLRKGDEIVVSPYIPQTTETWRFPPRPPR